MLLIIYGWSLMAQPYNVYNEVQNSCKMSVYLLVSTTINMLQFFLIWWTINDVRYFILKPVTVLVEKSFMWNADTWK